MDNQEKRTLLAAFAGRIVKVIKENVPGGASPRVTLDPADTIVEDVKKASGFELVRIRLPGTMVTMDYRINRLNVFVERDLHDGSYSVREITVG